MNPSVYYQIYLQGRHKASSPRGAWLALLVKHDVISAQVSQALEFETHIGLHAGFGVC